MSRAWRVVAACACMAAWGVALRLQAKEEAKAGPAEVSVERGRHLVKITGCNDCHTPGYAMSEGKVPEDKWLTGDTLGWRGPWGTTYAANLRRLTGGLAEEAWLTYVKTKPMRPPMPGYSLRDMTDDELRSIYRFIRGLGVAGDAAPDYVPPGQEPKPPFVTWPAPPPAG